MHLVKQPIELDTPGHAMLIRVDPRMPGVLDAAHGYILDALNRSGTRDWTYADVIHYLSTSAHLWLLYKDEEVFGALVTMETHYPQRKCLEVLLLGTDPGTEEHWVPLFEELKGIARANGCAAIIGQGRPGWARKLGATEHRTFEVDLWAAAEKQ